MEMERKNQKIPISQKVSSVKWAGKRAEVP